MTMSCYHHLTHLSFYVSSHFCLKIENAACGLQSQQNGPQWQPIPECSRDGLVLCNLWYIDTQTIALGGEIHVI